MLLCPRSQKPKNRFCSRGYGLAARGHGSQTKERRQRRQHITATIAFSQLNKYFNGVFYDTMWIWLEIPFSPVFPPAFLKYTGVVLLVVYI